MPAFVAALPAAFRRQIKNQCGGDWRRVTKDAGGGVMVHNQPQRDRDEDPPGPTRKVTPERVAKAAPAPPAWVPPRPLDRRQAAERRSSTDTSTFTRTELPAVIPLDRVREWARANGYEVSAKGRVPIKVMDAYRQSLEPAIQAPAEPPPPTPAPPQPEPEPPVEPQSPPTPQAEPAETAEPGLFSSAGPTRAGPGRDVTPLNVPPLRRVERPDKVIPNRRSGAPRTSKEMLKRLLDLGCRYVRVPQQPFAQIFYNGHLIMIVRCEDSLDRRVVVGQYASVRDDLKARGAIGEDVQ